MIVERRARERAVTLLELLMVIAIVGILATLAIPRYEYTRELAYSKEAFTNLQIIAAAEHGYRVEDDTGAYLSCSDVGDCAKKLKVSLTGANYDYSVTAASGPTPSTFVAHAHRTAGRYSGCEYTMDQDAAFPAAVDATQCP